MKNLAILAVCLSAGCVTSGDIRAVADSLAQLEAVVDSQEATVADVEKAFDVAKERIEDVAEAVDERTDKAEENLKDTRNVGGIAGLIGMAGLYFMRNLREKSLWGTPDEPKTGKPK